MAPTQIESDAHWHALRAKHIGGSDVAALFGLSPWQTHFTLWHEKAGKVAADAIEENDRMRWGKLLEPLLAAEIGRKLGWKLERSRVYHTHPTVSGMGCTLDFDVLDHQWGPGIVETKVVFDYADYARDWSENRAPPVYELQVQHQLACTGLAWAAIVVWVAQTATLAPALIRRPNEKVVAEIEARVAAFWQSVADDKAPDPSGTEGELELMRELWPAREPKKIVEFPDAKLAEACQQYLWAGEQIPGLEREKTANKAKLLAAARDAELMRVPGYDVGIKQNVKGHIRLDVREAPDNGVIAAVPQSTILAA